MPICQYRKRVKSELFLFTNLNFLCYNSASLYKRFVKEGSAINKSYRINNQIRVAEVRVLGVNGEQLGVMATPQALAAAKAQALDLVEISSSTVPPVCRIVNFGKFKYEQEKKEKAAKKNQKIVILKEIKIRPKIDIHDLTTKKNHIKDFIEKGNKVRVTIMFRGREMAHKEMGRDILDKILIEFQDFVDVEQASKLEGYNMAMVLAPKKGK